MRYVPFILLMIKTARNLEVFNKKMILSFNEAGYDDDNHVLLLRAIDQSL